MPRMDLGGEMIFGYLFRRLALKAIRLHGQAPW